MRITTSIILGLLISHAVFAQETSTTKAPMIVPPDKFDEWGDIRFADEIRHLDKIANQLKEWRLSIVYLVIYAGQKACNGEATARGARAKNHLLKRRIETERIVWIDAGWKKDLLVEAWIWPPEFGRPKPETDNTLKRSEVTIEPRCKIKHRGPSRLGLLD